MTYCVITSVSDRASDYLLYAFQIMRTFNAELSQSMLIYSGPGPRLLQLIMQHISR